MRNLKNIIVSFIVVVVLSGCQSTPTIPRADEIPVGESCIILKKNGFCLDQETGREFNLSFKQMRGWEAVSMEYKENLEVFIYDILEENAKLRIELENCNNLNYEGM